MKRQIVSALCISGFLALSMPVMADDSHSHGTATDTHGAKDEKKSGGRKKRQLMCKDCGKPETKCDCPEEVKAKERAEAAKKKAEGKEE